MYESFLGLTREPFSVAPDPRFLFLSPKHREALSHLMYGLRGGGGFVLLTGEIGAGKTTVWRTFLEQLSSNFDVAYVVNPKLGVAALMTRICDDLRIELPGGATVTDPVDAIHGHLLLSHATGRRTLIVVDEAQALSIDVLEQLRLLTNLVTAEREPALEDAGGVYALIGSTGVGKTTGTANLAAAFATRHGAAQLGLITLDAYRVGAHEQLRTYGRILGVPVHTAHDRASLEDLLELLSAKKMVLIDTAGMAQRDSRTRELLEMLSHRSIKRLLVVNAGAQGETIEDGLIAWCAAVCHGVILSKLDEAVKLAPALDALIRHKLKVLAVANGLMLQEMARLWDCPWSSEQLKQTALELGKAALALGLVEWSTQTLASLIKLHGATWLVGGTIQALSAAYLTRVVSHAMADVLALSAGVEAPDLERIKREAPLLVARAAEAEKLDWPGFLQQGRDWLGQQLASPGNGSLSATA
jgi:type II secretory pathway predicted ATPase ExeA